MADEPKKRVRDMKKQAAWSRAYEAKKDSISFMLPKGQKAKIKAAAQAAGMSPTKLIASVLKEKGIIDEI